MLVEPLTNKLRMFGYRPLCIGDDVKLLIVGETHWNPDYHLKQEGLIRFLNPTDLLHEFCKPGTYNPRNRKFTSFITDELEDWSDITIPKKETRHHNCNLRWLAHHYDLQLSGFDVNSGELIEIFDRIRAEDPPWVVDFFDRKVDIAREKIMGPRISRVVKNSEGLCLVIMGAEHSRPDSLIHQHLIDEDIGYAIIDQDNSYYQSGLRKEVA